MPDISSTPTAPSRDSKKFAPHLRRSAKKGVTPKKGVDRDIAQDVERVVEEASRGDRIARGAQLLVSISGIRSSTRNNAQELVSRLNEIGVPVTLIVSPHHRNHWHLNRDQATLNWLLGMQKGAEPANEPHLDPIQNGLAFSGFESSEPGESQEPTEQTDSQHRIDVSGSGDSSSQEPTSAISDRSEPDRSEPTRTTTSATSIPLESRPERVKSRAVKAKKRGKSSSKAEFAHLGAHESRLRLTAITRQLRHIGLTSSVFVPPKWSLSPHTLDVLPEFGFHVAGSDQGIHFLDAHATENARMLAVGEGYGHQKWWRRALSRSARSSAKNSKFVRISVNAKHLATSGVQDDIVSAVEAALSQGATPILYSNLAK